MGELFKTLLIKHATSENQPKLAETSRNHREAPTKPSTTIHNHRKPAKIIHNHPKPAENHLQTTKNLHKRSTQL